MNLRTKPNDEVFRLWRGELAFHYRSERSLREAERVVDKFEEFLGGYPPTVELAKRYLSQFLSHKPNTIARYTTLVGQFMKWYGEPLDIQIKQPKMLPQVTEPQDVSKLEAAMASRKSHKRKAQRDILLVETARLTGLRRAELANLKVGDLDFTNEVVLVRSGKGIRDRSVPLVPSLSAKLQTFCHGRKPSESLFGLRAVTISGKISSWAKKAGCPQIHAHSLRHQFGTELARKGVSARTIQSLLGHSDLAVTQRYLDVVGKDLRDAVNVLDETTTPNGTTPSIEELPKKTTMDAHLQPLVTIQPIHKQPHFDPKEVLASSYFSHFLVKNEGHGPAIEVEMVLLNSELDFFDTQRKTILGVGEAVEFRPVLHRPEGQYCVLCQYKLVSSQDENGGWAQTWLPFNLKKASEAGEVYVAPGELDFSSGILREKKVEIFPSKPKRGRPIQEA